MTAPDKWTPVRARLRNQRVGVISNREDPQLRQELERLMGIPVRWWLNNQRKLDSLCASLHQGQYDIIIALSGFVSHHTERMCSKAARRGSVIYIRAGKGRPGAMLLALRRDLGISD